MRPPIDTWQGCREHWQSAFIRENVLFLGHAAWQGYLTHGRGFVACEIAIADDAASVDWRGDAVPYRIQYIPAVACPAYFEFNHVPADCIHRLISVGQTYDPDREILTAIGGNGLRNGPIEIDWLRNLAIAPPDCYRQVCDRWEEFTLEPAV